MWQHPRQKAKSRLSSTSLDCYLLVLKYFSSCGCSPFKYLFIVLFYRQFRLCITKAQGKAHTPCRAGVYSRRLFLIQGVHYGGSPFASKCASALHCDSIITQIGRENKFSAEILLLRTVEDACPYSF